MLAALICALYIIEALGQVRAASLLALVDRHATKLSS